MEDKRKIFIIGGVALTLITGIILVVILIFGGGKNSFVKEGTIVWWGFEEKNEGISLLIDEYTSENSRVIVEYSQKGETPEEYERLLTDALAAGEGPDIIAVRNDWIPKHYNKLTSMPSEIYTETEFKDTFYNVAYEDLSKGEDIYALPFTIDTLAVFYNRGIATSDEPGETWDEFKEFVKEYRNLKGDHVEVAGTAMGTANNVEYSEDILYTIMLQNHTTMISDDHTKAYFNLSAKDKYGNQTYPGTSALSFYASFANPNKETYTWRPQMGNSFAMFTDNKITAIFGYAKDIERINTATNEELRLEVAKMPQVLGNEIYLAKYWAHGVSKDSTKQELAWDFLKFSTEKDINIDYANDLVIPSARKDTSEKQHNKYVKPFVEQLENATSWYKGDWLKTDKLFNSLITKIAEKGQKAQDAIDVAAKEMNKILSEVVLSE